MTAAMLAVLTMCPPSPCARMRGSTVSRPLTTPPIITRQAPVPVVVLGLVDGAQQPEAGVVDQHVDLAEGLLRLVGRARIGLAVGDVELEHLMRRLRCLRDEPGARVLEMILAHVGNDHAHAGRDHGLGDAETDAARAPGDECHLVFECLHVLSHPKRKRRARCRARLLFLHDCDSVEVAGELHVPLLRRTRLTFERRLAESRQVELVEKYSSSVMLVTPSAMRQVSSGLAHSIRALSSS